MISVIVFNATFNNIIALNTKMQIQNSTIFQVYRAVLFY